MSAIGEVSVAGRQTLCCDGPLCHTVYPDESQPRMTCWSCLLLLKRLDVVAYRELPF